MSLLAMVFVLAVGSPAHASGCTAGHPNALTVESTPNSDFTIPAARIVHLKTGLMWKACAEGQTWNISCVGTESTLNWEDALKAANTANTDASVGYGFTDWRLPNKKELESIVESCGYNPAFSLTRTHFRVTRRSISGQAPPMSTLRRKRGASASAMAALSPAPRRTATLCAWFVAATG
jgi:hypothetical protein